MKKTTILSLVLLFSATIIFAQIIKAEPDAPEETDAVTYDLLWENGFALTNNSSDPQGAVFPVVAAAPDGKTVIVGYSHKTGTGLNDADPYFVRSNMNGRRTPNSWSSPSPIYTSAATSDFLDITFDANSQAHAVWVEDSSNLYYGKENTWGLSGGSGPKQIYSVTPFSIEAPKIVASGTNKLDLVMAKNDGGELSIFHARSSNNGANWQPTPVEISTGIAGAGAATTPSIAVDNSGRLNVVWEQFLTGSIYEIYFSQSSDGGQNWSTPINLSSRITVGTSRQFHQAKIIAEGNSLFVAFENRPAQQQQQAYYVSCDSSCGNLNRWTGGAITVQNYAVKDSNPSYMIPQPAKIGGCWTVLFSAINGDPS
ncbi:MAG TPA: exo-alpha-sialidase, partial [Chloroflexi bacterium]|nr:exo-alpha-sialidase [Chloroflexota bacterium]